MNENNPVPVSRPSRWWWWVVFAFAFQAAVWLTWLLIAGQHRVAEVPLAPFR